MPIELVPLCEMRLVLREPMFLPDTPGGTRVIVEVAEGVVEGERLRGRITGAAAADRLTYEVYEVR